MTRKKRLTPIKDALAEQALTVGHEVFNGPSQDTKLSLERLLEETPEDNLDEEWENMASLGREF